MLCREEKTCLSCQKVSGVLCASAAATLHCPLHIPQQECPGWGFLGLPGCFLPCTALTEVLTRAYPQCLPLQDKTFFLGIESPVGESSVVSQLLDKQVGQKGKLDSFHLFSLSQSGNEGSKKLPPSDRKVIYLSACSSRIKTAARC